MKDIELGTDREAIFADLLAAFGRHDYETIRAAMRSDVVLVLLGTSPLAGTYRGVEELDRFVVALRAVLDTGRVVKYKKPGKLDYSVTVGEYALLNPRIAAFADNVFITERDRILHADALDLLAKERAGVPGSGTLGVPDDE